MHITLAFAMSLNGKITRGDESDVHAWTSDEDAKHFLQLRDESDVIVLDRPTYEVARPSPSSTILRVVLTHRPEAFSNVAVSGQLEFVTTTPTELVARLAAEGHKTVLLATGRTASADFLAAGLVDDIYLTFEPFVFGEGHDMLAEKPLEVALRLESVVKLNDGGTLLAHYIVQK